MKWIVLTPLIALIVAMIFSGCNFDPHGQKAKRKNTIGRYDLYFNGEKEPRYKSVIVDVGETGFINTHRIKTSEGKLLILSKGSAFHLEKLSK